MAVARQRREGEPLRRPSRLDPNEKTRRVPPRDGSDARRSGDRRVRGHRATNSQSRSSTRGPARRTKAQQAPAPVEALPSAAQGWSRELKVGVTQLVVVAVVFAAAAVWNASRDRGERGPSLLHTPSLAEQASDDEAQDKGSWLEGGAVRTLRSVTRSLDFSAKPSQPTPQEQRRARTKNFKGRLNDYELPAPSPRRVQRATERRVGKFLHRDLRFSSGESLERLVAQYREHLETQGYEVQQSQIGGLSGQGAELIGGRGADKATVKLKVGADGNTVGVTAYERIVSLERR